MAKKEMTVVPEIIDSVEALETKMAAMREAQKYLLPIPRSRLIRFSMRLQSQQTRCVSR